MKMPTARDLIVAFAAFITLALAAPPPAAAANAKTVICKDGTKDEGGQGACSGHGGVDKAATDKAASKEAKKHKEPAEPKHATVICKDGTKDEGGQGACGGHGGVDKAATEKAASKEAGKETKKEAKKHKEPAEPKHATVICKDGTKDEGGQGACSGHGGIDKAATDKAARPPPKEKPEHAAQPASHPGEKADDAAKGPPTARCKDGTFSHAEHHTGACSNHGGVEEWLDKK